MDDFSKYARMCAAGSGPGDVYLAAKADGLDPAALIRLLRTVFHLSLAEAKEVTVVAEGLAGSLEEAQERFRPALQQALEATEPAKTPR